MKAFRILLLAVLIIGVAGITPVTADLTVVPEGGTVFVGEEGLTFEGIPAGTTLYWFAPGDPPSTAVPSATYTTQGPGNEVIAPATFQTHTGNWYTVAGSPVVATVIITVRMPAIDVRAFNTETCEDMTNGRVVKTGTAIAFRLDSNLYEAVNQRYPELPGQTPDIKVVVLDEEGTRYNGLVEDAASGAVSQLTGLAPTSSQFYLPDSTGASGVRVPNWDLESEQYKYGAYTFYAQVNLNNVGDNIGTVTGATTSEVKTIEIEKDFVNIEANKDNVVRNNDFAVTITGRSEEYYVLWVKGTNNISAPDTVPYIKQNQDEVYFTGTTQGENAGLYQFLAGQSVHLDVYQNDPTVWRAYYAMVKLSGAGIRTVGFDTGDTTKNQTYTIRADHIPYLNATKNPAMTYVADKPMNDTVQVTVGETVTVTDFRANVTSGVAPQAIAFTDLSTGTPTGWNWSFGDGATSTEQNPVHQYTSAGNYTACLTADGCGECCTKPEYIKITPVLFGDANNDDQVNQADTLRVLKEIVGLTVPPVKNTKAFEKTDVHQNDVIEIGDVMFIAQYNVGLRGPWFELL